jgi:hypothetical protein
MDEADRRSAIERDEEHRFAQPPASAEEFVCALRVGWRFVEDAVRIEERRHGADVVGTSLGQAYLHVSAAR